MMTTTRTIKPISISSTFRPEDDTAKGSKGMGVKTVLAGAMAVLMAVSTGVVMLAFAGAAVLFMPMLGGMSNE